MDHNAEALYYLSVMDLKCVNKATHLSYTTYAPQVKQQYPTFLQYVVYKKKIFKNVYSASIANKVNI